MEIDDGEQNKKRNHLQKYGGIQRKIPPCEI
jgi:hypothetical protein